MKNIDVPVAAIESEKVRGGQWELMVSYSMDARVRNTLDGEEHHTLGLETANNYQIADRNRKSSRCDAQICSRGLLT